MSEQHKGLRGRLVLFLVSASGLAALVGAFQSTYWLYYLGFATPHIFFSTSGLPTQDVINILTPAYALGVILFSAMATQAGRHPLLASFLGFGAYALDTWAAVATHIHAALPFHILVLCAFLMAIKNELAHLKLSRRSSQPSRPEPKLETVINRQVTIGKPGLAARTSYVEDYDEEPEAASPLSSAEMELRRRTYHGRLKS